MELTELQSAFVHHLVNGASSATDAARSAGYSGNGVRQVASQLMRKEHVQSAIRQEQFLRLNGDLANIALETLRSVMQDETAPAGARVTASVAVLERAGFSAQAGRDAIQQKQVSEMTNAELAEFIADTRRLIERHEHEQFVMTVDSDPCEADISRNSL